MLQESVGLTSDMCVFQKTLTIRLIIVNFTDNLLAIMDT